MSDDVLRILDHTEPKRNGRGKQEQQKQAQRLVEKQGHKSAAEAGPRSDKESKKAQHAEEERRKQENAIQRVVTSLTAWFLFTVCGLYMLQEHLRYEWNLLATEPAVSLFVRRGGIYSWLAAFCVSGWWALSSVNKLNFYPGIAIGGPVGQLLFRIIRNVPRYRYWLLVSCAGYLGTGWYITEGGRKVIAQFGFYLVILLHLLFRLSLR